MEDSAFSQADFDEVGKLSAVAASVLMKALYLARCCGFDLLHPICMLARQVTKWSRACDKRPHKLISYLHTTREYSLEGFVGDDCKGVRTSRSFATLTRPLRTAFSPPSLPLEPSWPLWALARSSQSMRWRRNRRASRTRARNPRLWPSTLVFVLRASPSSGSGTSWLRLWRVRGRAEVSRRVLVSPSPSPTLHNRGTLRTSTTCSISVESSEATLTRAKGTSPHATHSC